MTRIAKSSAMCLAALVTLTFTALPARAETPLHRPVEVNFDGVSVESALATLGERVGVRFEYDADLMKGQYSVTYQAEDQEAGRVAMRILYPRGLELGEMRGNRVRIVKRDPYDEFKPKREENYEFVRKPTLTREGDDVTITFETAGWCDVTVAIEDEQGDIIRHLASGVLGPNAPEPFVWNSRAQTLVWDGKNDKGEYVDDKDAVSVRVSLGLKPRFDRTLFWHPGKAAARDINLAAGPEGVYVFQGGAFLDHVRLFDRDGDYVRTVYPFPNRRLEQIRGLHWHEFPDGERIPIKPNYTQSTLLISDSPCVKTTYNPETQQYRGVAGPRSGFNDRLHWSAGGPMTTVDDQIALVSSRVIRLTDGAPGGLALHGPLVTLNSDNPRFQRRGQRLDDAECLVRPRRAALCPEGKWLYLTMYNEYSPGGRLQSGNWIRTIWHHKILRLRYEGDERPTLFAGGETAGDKDGQFNIPADVACDQQGRVYVADHLNDRIQVFDSDGKHLRNIAVDKPTRLHLHRETGEIFVFSWALPVPLRPNAYGIRTSIQPQDRANQYYRLTRFSALDDGAERQDSWDLQQATGLERTIWSNVEMDAVVDDGSDPVRVWITRPRLGRHDPVPDPSFGGTISRERGFLLLTLEDGQWTLKRDSVEEASRAIEWAEPSFMNRQRLYVNPTDGQLYVSWEEGYCKSFKTVLRIDPETGRLRQVQLPLSTEDMAFDQDGHAYLRTSDQIIRYTADFSREIPFDYGEERARVGYGSGGGSRTAHVLSGAVFPGNVGFHQGGMHVNARGDIAVGVLYQSGLRSRENEAQLHDGTGFEPVMYPGRRYRPDAARWSGMLIHVLDRHGHLRHKDAVPGLPNLANGIGIDARGDIYFLSAAVRMYDGEEYFNNCAGTVMKFTPGEARLRSPEGAAVPLEQKPDRPLDLSRWGGSAWVEGAHWFYGGVGWGGKNPGTPACACPNSRFALDYFARSFTPEIDRYNVGIVDSSGNLILRIGQPGNIDDGVPLVKDGGPANQRSIGGDETPLKFAPYVATHTDRRLFIADPGNERIVSVKLDYHTDETVSLGDVPDAAGD